MDIKQKNTVLIIDDDLNFLNAIAQLLEEEFNIRTVTSVIEAKKIIKSKSKIDLIITDIVLGKSRENSGLAIIEYIKNEEKLDLPIVVISGYLSEYYKDLLNIGVDLIISKIKIDWSHLTYDLKKILLERSSIAKSKLDQSFRVDDLKKVFFDELEQYSRIKASTLAIPEFGNYELIKPLIGFKPDIEKQIIKYPFSKNVFLMMKFRESNKDLSDFIIETLSKYELNCVRADDTDWSITSNVYNPLAVLYCCRFGIALFDESEVKQAYSPNVAYELGIMHYQCKECLILRHSSLPPVPFDIMKDLYVNYDKDLQVRKKVESWIEKITSI